MEGYDTAQICLNGHKITGSYHKSPQFHSKFCKTCGQPTIIKCQECNAEIKGSYSGVGVGFSSQVQAFCHNCGKPYPWTKSKIDSAKELAQEFENLSKEDKDILSKSIDDLVADTPRTTLAASRFKRIMSKVGKMAYSEMKTILVDLASSTAKKTMFGQ